MTRTKRFYQFVIPSVGAMLVTGLYVIVDGIFVGQGVGAEALAEISIAVPYIAILTSVSMMITMGGATVAAVFFGRGNKEAANRTFHTSLAMVMLFSLLMAMVTVPFSEEIARLFGASESLVEGAALYIKYYVIFGVFTGSARVMSAFACNDGNPRLAFWGMVMGALSNIFLDWLFIYPLGMGIKGASIATGLGNVMSCLVLMTHYLRRRGVLRLAIPRLDMPLMRRILKVGGPEFITSMGQPITVLCYNFIVLRFFDEVGVAAYSVISYLVLVVIYVFMGVAQGMQPLLSMSYGEGNEEQERFFFKMGLRLNIVLGIVMYAILFFFGREIISVFNSDPELVEIAYDCVVIYGIALVLSAVNITCTTYNLATERTKNAMAITVLRSVSLNCIFVFLMPLVFGIDAVWTGMIVSEAIVICIIGYPYIKKQIREKRLEKTTIPC